MSLTSLRLSNFKCFEDSREIPLAPLTLIFGRNNSGKSSIIQSLLLLRQSIRAPMEMPRLYLAGPLYAVGSFEDIVHQHEANRQLSIALQLTISANETANIKLIFEKDYWLPPRLKQLKIVSDGVLPVDIRRGRGAGGPYQLWIDNKLQGGTDKAQFGFYHGSVLPLLGPAPRGQQVQASTAQKQARQFADQVLVVLNQQLMGLRTVGAFRRPPERSYEYEGFSEPEFGSVRRDVISALIVSSLEKQKDSRYDLLSLVNGWLKKVTNVAILPPQQLDKAGRRFCLQVKDLESGRIANYADVGFGISQALPVIIEGLSTRKDGIFVAMEPEIHLHPDAQLAMADFLVDLSRTGRQVIVETHSEHILLRVRQRVLQGAQKGLGTEDVSLIHVARDKNIAGQARVLPIDALGQVENWPEGFFSEANNERMALLEHMAAKLEADES